MLNDRYAFQTNGIFHKAAGWSIVYFEGSQVIASKNIFLSLKIDFALVNDEMHDVAFRLDLQFAKVPVFGPPVYKGNLDKLIMTMSMRHVYI